jgi:hypothetical protein
MSLRDDLKTWIPKLLLEVYNRPPGYKITADDWNTMWNLNRSQGDYNTETIQDILTMLYETVLNDTNGAQHVTLSDPNFTATNVLTAIQELVSDDAATNTALNLLTAALATHKTSADHDGRYYTAAQLIAGILDTRYITNNQIEFDSMNIVAEVFIVSNADNGDGTFTYTDKHGQSVVSARTGMGHVFKLQLADYTLGSNQIKALINDTLQRTAVSGGLVEVDSTTIEITPHCTTGAEITIEYYTRLNNFGAGVYYGATEPQTKYLGKMWITP